MLNSIYRALIRKNVSVIRVFNPTPNKLFYVQINSFSSKVQKPISQSINEDSFTVNYLINTFGFSPERALSATKYLKVGSKEKPDLVIAFLKNHGFTKDQIVRMVRNYPPIIACCPEKTLLPKIEFFRSCGVSDSELTKIFVRAPVLFKRNLDKIVMPSFKYVQSLLISNGANPDSIYRWAQILVCDLQSVLLPNVEILRDAGVPDANILALLQFWPRTLISDTEKFRKVVEEVKEMRFDPAETKFILGIKAFRSVSKPAWEKRVAVYKKWGWSENDIIQAFKMSPHFMMLSTDKITAMMDFIVNKMGFDSSLVLKTPQIISSSLKKRIKPRFLVYSNLVEKGLIKKGSLLPSTFTFTESNFLKRFVQRYEKEAPELLQLYEQALAVPKS